MNCSPSADSRVRKNLFVVLALLSAAQTAGCGLEPTECFVTGEVYVNDEPAAGVYVMFHPTGGDTANRPSATARTGDDGIYSWKVPERGDYAMTLFWPRQTIADDDVLEGEDRFGGQYRNPQQPVLEFTVENQDNLLPPLELKPVRLR